MIGKKTVLILGNPIENLDKPAVKLIPLFKKGFPRIDFIHFDPTEELPPDYGDNLIIIDTIEGIKKVQMFNCLEQFALSARNSVHDYDLPLHLGISKKLGRIKKLTIIGIPAKGEKEKILENTKKILKSL